MNDETTTIDGQVEVIEPTALEAITKAEVDIQIATAHRYPRSLEMFKKRALSMVTQDEETAASCIYKLTRKSKDGTKVIEGESVRMAEIVASAYGNMRVAAQITNQTPTRVTVRAVAHDLENNVLMAQEKQLKTTYSDGTPYKEDMAVVATNALISKAIRDAIFRVVPKAMVKTLKESAKQVAVGTAATLHVRRSKAMEWVHSLKIDPARVFAILGVKGENDIGIEQLEVLTGLRTAIREGDQTVDDAFPKPETPIRPIFGQAAPLPTDEQSQADAGLAPEVPRRGRPPGSKNRTKEEGSPTPPPVQEPVQPAPPVETSTPTPTTSQDQLASFLLDAGVSFDDARDFMQVKGLIKDPDSIPSFAEIPSDVCERLHKDTKLLIELVKKFGKQD